MSIEEAHQPPSLQRPMRLLLVADSLDVGGAEWHVVNLASALAEQGHRITLACTVEGVLAPLAEQAGISVRPLLHHLVKRRQSPRYAWKLAKLVRQSQFDLVHAHMYASALASAYALLGTSIPLVITEHSQANWRSHCACRCSQWSYSQARHVIAVSREIRRRLIEQEGVPSDRISVIMNALPPVSEQHKSIQPDLPAALRNGLLVGVAARLQPEKGVAYFLEAAAHVLQFLPEVHFLVMGDGPQRKELQAYVEQPGVQEHVHFLGFRLDARAIIGLLDVLVVPSLSEGTPLVTLEAMSAGVPVVASAVGGIPEQVRHQSEGILVPPGDALALGEAVLHLLQNPTWMQQLGEAGRQRALSRFSFTTMLQETENVYRATLGWPPGSDIGNRELVDPLTETGR
ncbi:MAG: glycosyltransferase family 4 protein [Chloroflexi bacterium]|nr:MAG: glycosyltransferase family 4 protein [Chloroflexota bacterium]